MCGLFGAIGQNISIDKIRALAIANRARGTDGIGFFDNSGKIVKRGRDSLIALCERAFADYLKHKKRWFLAGHTRAATQGKVSDRNAHPFRYGSIVGAHNGIVTAPAQYKVDSEYLIDSIDKASGDYQKALADISGWWALTWFDGDAFYMQASGNTVTLGSDGNGTYYYSSDDEHLAAATGISGNVITLDKGATIRFKQGCADFEVLPDLVRTNNPIKYTITSGKSGSAGKTDDKWWNKWDEWDDLAWDLGYSDLDDVMEREGLNSRHAAQDFLESAFYRNVKESNDVDLWDEYSRDME